MREETTERVRRVKSLDEIKDWQLDAEMVHEVSRRTRAFLYGRLLRTPEIQKNKDGSYRVRQEMVWGKWPRDLYREKGMKK